jgi:type II secretory pathway component PulF
LIREVIGATMSLVGGIYLLWFILPQLNTAYEGVKSSVNATDPTTQIIIGIGDNVYALLGFLTVLIVLFTVIVYFVRREPIDVRY